MGGKASVVRVAPSLNGHELAFEKFTAALNKRGTNDVHLLQELEISSVEKVLENAHVKTLFGYIGCSSKNDQTKILQMYQRRGSMNVNSKRKYLAVSKKRLPIMNLCPTTLVDIFERSSFFLKVIIKCQLAMHLTKSGKFEAAVPICRKSLTLAREFWGFEHVKTLDQQDLLVICLEQVGEYEEALQVSLKTLDIRRSTLGVNHQSTLRSMETAAVRLYDMGWKREEALSLFHECLLHRRKVLGDKHRDTLKSILLTANCLVDMHNDQYRYCVRKELRRMRYKEAVGLYRELLIKSKKVFGKRHSFTLTTMERMAQALWKEEKEEALELYRECLTGYKKVSGKTHDISLRVLARLAKCFDDMKEYEKALPFHRECLNARKKVLGKTHHSTLISVWNMGSCLRNMKKPEEALALYREWATYFFDLKKYNEALPFYRESLMMCRESLMMCREKFGRRHPKTLTLLFDYAELHDVMGRKMQAMFLHDHCLSMRKQVLGETHKDTLESMLRVSECMIWMYQQNKNSRQCLIQLLKKCLELRKKALGEADPLTKDVEKYLQCELEGPKSRHIIDSGCDETILRYRIPNMVYQWVNGWTHGVFASKYGFQVSRINANRIHCDPESNYNLMSTKQILQVHKGKGILFTEKGVYLVDDFTSRGAKFIGDKNYDTRKENIPYLIGLTKEHNSTFMPCEDIVMQKGKIQMNPTSDNEDSEADDNGDEH